MKEINLLSCLVRYGDVALPIGYEVGEKDILFSDIKTRHKKRKASISKNEMFRALIQQVVNNHVLFDYIFSDNWFGSKANMTFIHQALDWTLAFFDDEQSMQKGLKYLDLIEPTQIPIRRHIKIKAEATPYDPDYTDYFIERYNLHKGKRLYRPCGKTWSYWWDMENANDNCIGWTM